MSYRSLKKVSTPHAELLAEEVSSQLANRMSRVASDNFLSGRREAIEDELAEFGFTDVAKGQGSYCLSVVRHPDLPSVVYKLVAAGDKGDDAYIEYAEWLFHTRAFERNPHFPRIHSITYSEDRSVALVAMEELHEFNWYAAPEYLKSDFWLLRKHLGLRNPDAPEGWAGRNRPLITAASLMHETFSGLPLVYFDIHKGNVMLRGELLVINDPLAYSCS